MCHSVLMLLKLCLVLSTKSAIRYAEMKMGYTLVNAPWPWPNPGSGAESSSYCMGYITLQRDLEGVLYTVKAL